MEFADLKNKTESELQELLAETREQIRELRFKLSEKQAKNMHSMKLLKRSIAKILTVLNQRKTENK